MIERLLKDMNFMKETKVNYDPHHNISQKRKHNKNKAFEHQEVQGLVERDNLIDYQSDVEDTKNI